MRVAVAGYGDLTRYICEEFAKADLELVILTRKHNPQLEDSKISQAITDYTLPSLKTALADCDVLISTIGANSSVYTDIHSTLLQACKQSLKCKRFIPAEFGANIRDYPDQPGFYYAPHEPVREMLRNQTDIEWTMICVGWLADYFVPTKNRYMRDIGEWHPINWVNDEIVIPGTGNEPVDFTWTRDIASGLALLVKAPSNSWEPYTFMSGQHSCWNDMAKLMKQKYRPNSPVEHRSLYTVAEMIKTAKDETTWMLADLYLYSISQACGMPPDKVQSHREKYFSGLRFRTVEDGLAQFDDYPDSII